MRAAEVFRFELHYRFRQPSTWIYGALLFGMPFLMLHAVDGGTVPVNAPETLMEVAGGLSIIAMLVTAALLGDALLRDVQTGIHPLFYTTPITKLDYLAGRFLGALLVNALLLPAILLANVVASWMPYMADEMWGPFIWDAYWQPFVYLMLPNLLITGSLIFALAALTRSTLATYIGGITLFFGYIIGLDLAGLHRNRVLSVMLDPFGMTAVDHAKRYFTEAERATRLIGLPDLLLWNRLLWIGIALVVLAAVYALFRFAQGGVVLWRRRGRRQKGAAGARGPADPDEARPAVGAVVAPMSVPSVRGRRGAAVRARQTLAVAGQSLRQIVLSWPFAFILVGTLVLVLAYGWNIGSIVFGTSSWPVTHLLAGTALTVPINMIMPVLLALFAGELIWRDRDAGLAEIADVTPVPNWVPLLGRFLGLAGMIVLVQAVLMAAGIVLQALQGYYRFEPGLYLRILFGINLSDYLIFAVVAVAIHVIVNHKYMGHLLVVLLYLFTVFGPLEHNLLIFGSDPGWVYSDMSGFGPFVGPLVWFRLYWAGWALLAAVAATVFWVRGKEGGARPRLALARQRLRGGTAGVAVVGALVVMALGGFIFYNTNILNEYRTPFESEWLRAEYERRYERFEEAPQPQIVAADLRVEVYPDEREAEVRGQYRLINDTGQPIDSIHVVTNRDVATLALELSAPAVPALDDTELGYRIYRLQRPLAAGDSLRLDFHVAFRPAGFPNRGVPTDVVENGAYFERRWLPIIGYQPGLELRGDQVRQEHELPPQPVFPAADDPRALAERSDLRDADRVRVETIIGTDDDQIAVTVGGLVREWTEDGRRYFHYRTDGPERFGTPILSASYDVLEDRWHDVALQIFHHPTHTFNLDRMVRSMKASLDYFTTHFGPYRYDRLRIVEFPRYASFARAHPHTITFSEGSAFLTRVEEGDVDRPFFVIAHEAAHQWWGGEVSGARVAGAGFLSETLAQYSAMMVMEEVYGRDRVQRFYAYELDRYLTGRRVFANREVPLLDVEDQPHLYYHKGAVVMYRLRELIGEGRVNQALRRFYETWAGAGPPYPTSRDLYQELKAVTPDSLGSVLHDLFETVTVWDLHARSARLETVAGGAAEGEPVGEDGVVAEDEAVKGEPSGDGYRVVVEIDARKLRSTDGEQSEIPMDDPVEIALYGLEEGGWGRGQEIHRETHRLGSGEQTVVLTVRERPHFVVLDPDQKLIEPPVRANLVRIDD